MLEKGENVKQSDQLAFKYYKMSADAGHYKAQFNVGEFYYRGYITHKLIPPDTFRWNIEFEQSYTNARTYLVKANYFSPEKCCNYYHLYRLHLFC